MAEKFGLLGRKLGHSWSPQIHGLLCGYDYALIEKEPEELADTPIFMISRGRASHMDKIRDILLDAGVHILDVANLFGLIYHLQKINGSL